MVNMDEIQFGFALGRCTTGAIIVVCQLQEKYITANKLLYFPFDDPEKVVDCVTRNVLWWAVRGIGDEAVHAIQVMHYNAWSRVWVNGQKSEEFGMGVGVHLSSVLSIFLFILMLEALSHEFRTGVPLELYADDLVLVADTQEEGI